eukprot:439909-Amphidinium_carterae.4
MPGHTPPYSEFADHEDCFGAQNVAGSLGTTFVVKELLSTKMGHPDPVWGLSAAKALAALFAMKLYDSQWQCARIGVSIA